MSAPCSLVGINENTFIQLEASSFLTYFFEQTSITCRRYRSFSERSRTHTLGSKEVRVKARVKGCFKLEGVNQDKMGEIAILGSIVIQIATTIQAMGNNWYRASTDWTDFPRKVDRLRRKHDFWQAEFTKTGMLLDLSLMKTLHEARALLEEEQEKLLRRRARWCAGFWPKVNMALFPSKVGLKIQLVIEAFDAIPALLQLEEEALVALDNRMKRRAPYLPIKNDDRYVHFKVTESTIHLALDLLCPPVVLLHGGPGTGKSTLAQHIAALYCQKTGSITALFDRVVFLECGPEANALTKQFELVQQLGPGSDAASIESQGQTSSNSAIRNRLSNLLKHQKILIIFDDVWEGEFLQRMLDLCGVGVKSLVTSQRGNLCRGLSISSTRIQIEEVQREVAMQLLASHVGFTDKLIPKHIQGVADKMIQETEGNPLALASIATAINYERSDELVEWEAAYQNLSKLLHSKDTLQLWGLNYSKSFWLATRLSVQALKEDVQNLLILVHMCDGPAIPEDVLHAFYLSAIFPDSYETFEKSRNDLESRELLKITSQSLGYNTLGKRRSWSVHSLQKRFIESEMRHRKEAMFTVLVGNPTERNAESGGQTKINRKVQEDEDFMVRIALCALYLDTRFSDKAASKMNIPIHRINNLRKNAIEPITRLLVQPLSARWTADALSSARQIFLKYIYNCELHSDGISDLLGLPVSSLPMLSALEDIATVEETTLLDGNSQGLMKSLVDLLEVLNTGDDSRAKAKAAARAIDQLSRNKLHYGIVISSGILGKIVSILSSKAHLDLQVISTNILAALSYAGCEMGDWETIVQNPGTLEVLVKSLCNKDNLCLQESATLALGNLAATQVKETKVRFSHFPKALDQLISFLSRDTVPNLQLLATRALANLALGVEETKQTIINSSTAMEQLVNMLSKDNSSALQSEAARTLATLAATKVQQTKLKIIDHPDALKKIVYSISQDINPGLQKHAALSIQNLSQEMGHADVEYTRRKLNETEGLMDGLLGLLDERVDPITQNSAVTAVTFIDQSRVNRALLHSASQYKRRGHANMMLGLNKECLADLNKADEIEPGDLFTLRNRVTVKAKLRDCEGALADLNIIMKEDSTLLDLQERGVLKRMLGDMHGALADLNEVLISDPNDYEALKHRAYVKFLMNDENGARSDAEFGAQSHT